MGHLHVCVCVCVWGREENHSSNALAVGMSQMHVCHKKQSVTTSLFNRSYMLVGEGLVFSASFLLNADNGMIEGDISCQGYKW